MRTVLALAGDTMLGRGVAEVLDRRPPRALFDEAVVAAVREADLCVLNLECCISTRGRPWPDPRKPFYFRAPPAAVEALVSLGVDAVTLANNHALDFGEEALLDTLGHLEEAGIAHVGAGPDLAAARAPVVLTAPTGPRLGVVGFTDHPADFAAAEDRPGTAHVDLEGGLPGWVREVVDGVVAEAVLVTPHWGPNMTASPVPRVRGAATDLAGTRATLVAGHSAHVFHGVGRIHRPGEATSPDRQTGSGEGPPPAGPPRRQALAEGREPGSVPGPGARLPVLFDLGDFVDDYAVEPRLRNDLGLLWLVTLEDGAAVAVEALPLKLEYCFTRVADGEDAAWIRRRLGEACRELGTRVEPAGDARLRVPLAG